MRGVAKLVVALGFAVAGAHTAPGQEQYPSRPIRLVVGFAAGGPTDIPARFIADKLGDLLGQKVVVENKTGAGGMLATRDVLAQPRDGYTLLLCTHFEAINAAIYRNPQYALADIAPISLTSRYYYALAVTNALPTDDLESFIRYARENPGKVSYATVGAGSAQEIFARELEKLTGITMTSVPYRGGAPIMQDLIPGRVQFYVAPTANVMSFVDKGELRAVAISSPERIKSAPKVPTLREKGIDFVRFGFLGVCAAKGTPEPILARLNKAIRTAVAMPDYQALIERTGSIPESSTPQELAATISQMRDETAAAAKAFGMERDN